MQKSEPAANPEAYVVALAGLTHHPSRRPRLLSQRGPPPRAP